MSNKIIQTSVPYAIFDKRSFGQEILRELIAIVQPNWPEIHIFEIQPSLPLRHDISAEEVARKLNQINNTLSKVCGIRPIRPFKLIDGKTTYHQIALYLIDLAVHVRKSIIEKIPDLDEKEQIDLSMFHLFECPACLARILRLIGCFLLSLEGLDFDNWLKLWELVSDIESGDFHQKINDQRYAEGG